MAKLKTTQSAAKHSNHTVLAVPYCFLQNVLKYESPIAYNTRRDGWNFDLYKINDKYSIVTGYRGMSRASTHSLLDNRQLNDDLKQLETDSYNYHDADFKDVYNNALVSLLDKHLKDA